MAARVYRPSLMRRTTCPTVAERAVRYSRLMRERRGRYIGSRGWPTAPFCDAPDALDMAEALYRSIELQLEQVERVRHGRELGAVLGRYLVHLGSDHILEG